MKCATVAVVGRPSSGKSSLVNALCGSKVSITAPVPQTTRNRIRGIYTEERGQLIFIDTPGYHLSERKFNLRLRTLVTESLDEVDLVLYVLDGSRAPGEEEAGLAAAVRACSVPLVLAVNKEDLGSPLATEVLQLAAERFPGRPCQSISALAGTGLEELKNDLFGLAPEGEQLYPAEYYTDQEPGFRAAEIIREKALLGTREEVPHCVYVEIEDFEARDGGERFWIRAALNVERESQKGILVGKAGTKIRALRLEAQQELEAVFERPVSLDLRVKVSKDWRRNDKLLRNLLT